MQIANLNLKNFTLDELEAATRNFNMLLGESGLRELFLGWVDENSYAPSAVGVGMAIVVKKLDPRDFQRHPGWQIELQFSERFSHPNLTSIWGYCMENEKFFAVYEYMPEYMQNRSLESYLFVEDAEPVLPWFTRLKIAIGAARGLAFLHRTVKQVIYRQFDPSSILLDEEFNAKLWNFDIAKLAGVTCYSRVFRCARTLDTDDMWNYGNTDPEYLTTGYLTMKSDVYGFGVVLLELLTGLPVFDVHRPGQSKFLVNWVSHFTFDEMRVRRVTDPRLRFNYPLEGALQYVLLVQKCLDQSANRPTMVEVLDALVHIDGIKMDPSGNSRPTGSDFIELEGDDGSTYISEHSLSVEMPRYREVGSSPNNYSGSKEDLELSGPR